jgi:GT2 family glycosyltransferase
MELSVIIVNYNVRHFLEQCLFSVRAALQGLEAQVIVIDNDSRDKSIDYLKPTFPGVTFVQNEQNAGFAKACNQGLALSSGNYVLFLNPDTIVPESCFRDCIAFFKDHKDAGALGCRMVDGSGKFLRESKRAFPSPLTSLYKLFGFARLFPRSRIFSKYHLGHLSPDRDNEVDVLAGAFFMTRREVLQKVGSFDETFFMYGEDVDLSYRIQRAGWKNFYFAGTTIIHFKGESTRKGSMNYVRMFYQAMSIFVRKHYGGSRAGIFNALIHVAIWVRATFSATGQFIRKIGLPLLDAGLILLSFWTVKEIWTRYVRPEIQYDTHLLWIAFPAYTVFYLLTAYYAGLYDRWYRRSELVRSTLIATIALLAAYALLPEHYRFSRGIIVFGSLLAFVMVSVLRFFLLRTGVLSSTRPSGEADSSVVAGTEEEFAEVVSLLGSASPQRKILGRVAVNGGSEKALGSLENLPALTSTIPFRELIFCQGHLAFSDIIAQLQKIPADVRARIHSSGSRSIVGSDSKDQSGQAVSMESGFQLADPYRRRTKRLVDIIISMGSLIVFPVHFFTVKKPLGFLANCIGVLFAKRTWIGYASTGKNLPRIRRGIIACNGMPGSAGQALPAESLDMLDYWYARDYEPSTDLKLISRSYRLLGS